MKKRFSALLLAVFMLCLMHLPAYAYPALDLSKKGSISITMTYNKKTVSGGTLTLYHVGAVSENDGNDSFVLTGDFEDCGISLDELQTADLAKKLEQYAVKQNLIGITKEIGKDGTVSFTDLELGLYLLVQKQAAAGYNKVDPFLVTVPMSENGEYIYDVDASPKVELHAKVTTSNQTTPSPDPTKPKPPNSSTLPKTGQLNWPIPILVIAGLGLFSIGWMLRYGKP